MAQGSDSVKRQRGFLLGKFLPPHAGHLSLVHSAQRLVDELTVLVCWLPDDPISGALRLEWMRSLCPGCKVIGFGEIVPQQPEDSLDFWTIWQTIVRSVHPEPIDLLFAGEAYGAELAEHVGGLFVPLGNRVLGAGSDQLGQISASAIRNDPVRNWNLMPEVVRAHFRKRICLHGSESTGKSTLAALLAGAYGTIWVGEYGRSHCEAHRGDLSLADLTLIANAQQAMNGAAAQWAGPILLTNTDPLMTAAWTEMLLGSRPQVMMEQPKADLYLLMEPDIPWVNDGTRFFSSLEDRRKFAAIVEQVLIDAGVNFVRVSGNWADREQQGLAEMQTLMAQVGVPLTAQLAAGA